MLKRKVLVLSTSIVCIVLFRIFLHERLPQVEITESYYIIDTIQPTVLHNDIAMEEARRDNIERLNRIRETCTKYNLGHYKTSSHNSSFKYPPSPQYSVFYYDVSEQLSYCPIYKAGSSTWLYNYCLLGGETVESMKASSEQLSTIARRLYPEMEYDQAKAILEDTAKLLVVRHPFDRLLSAYRDKLENINAGWAHGTAHFYKKYGAAIVKKYRPKGKKLEDLLKPFNYFRDTRKPPPSGIEPTFKEFVRYLIDTDLLNYADDHWIMYNLFCTPCLVKYDYVSKVETLDRDQLYVIRERGLEQLIRPRWIHNSQPVNLEKNEISKMYFSQLSKTEVKSLYEKYKLDFEMFAYFPDEYIQYANDD